jgi:hypothetical protein
VYPTKIPAAIISGLLDITPSALAARCAPIICARSPGACRACVSTNPKVCVYAPPQLVVGIHSQLLRYIAAVRIGVVWHKRCHGGWPGCPSHGDLWSRRAQGRARSATAGRSRRNVEGAKIHVYARCGQEAFQL